MKRIYSIFAVAFLLIIPGMKANDDQTPNQGPMYHKVILKKESSHHRVPSSSSIGFKIENGLIIFSQTDLFMALEVTVTNDASGETWTGCVSPDIPYMDGPDEPGSYSITCLNPEGQSYIGFFEL